MGVPGIRTYGTAVTKPADFDDFWADVMEQAAHIPLNATANPVPLQFHAGRRGV